MLSHEKIQLSNKQISKHPHYQHCDRHRQHEAGSSSVSPAVTWEYYGYSFHSSLSSILSMHQMTVNTVFAVNSGSRAQLHSPWVRQTFVWKNN